MTTRVAGANDDPPAIEASTSAIVKIEEIKLYVPIVTSSAKNDNKWLEQLKKGFKRTIKWNNYRLEVSN